MDRSGRAVAALALVVGVTAAGWVSVPQRAVHASARDDREAGKALFAQKGCTHCHGEGAVGGERGPSLLGVGRKLKQDQIRHQIEAGGGGMPAFAEVLQPDEVSHLVDWLKTQKSRKPAANAAPAKPASADQNGSDDQK